MVVISCPHCSGELELDDDASGDFECPHCAGEFAWEQPKEVVYNIPEDSRFVKNMLKLNAFLIGFTIFAIILIVAALSAYSG